MHRSIPLLACACLLTLAVNVRAHDPGMSAVTLRETADGYAFEVVVRDVELPPTRRASTPACTGRGVVTAWVDGESRTPEATCSVGDDGHTRFEGSLAGLGTRALSAELSLLAELPRGHYSFARVLDRAGQMIARRVLRQGAGRVDLALPRTSAADFFGLGVTHVLEGADHLLFLLVLVAGVAHLRRLAVLISCFTVAHALTLALATYRLVAVPSAPVEALIAASIVAVGVRNCARGEGSRERVAAVAAFGLIHGLGMASAFTSGAGSSVGPSVLASLALFNLGVEVAQIGFGMTAFALLALVRRVASRGEVSQVVSGTAAAVGCVWLVQRALPLFAR